MDYTNPVALRLREVARRLGILKPIQRLYRLILSADYEQRFEHVLMRAIRPNDTVWDVGANVGYYTRKIAARLDIAGQIVAFEPASEAVQLLRENCATVGQLCVEEAALGESEGMTDFFLSSIGADPTNSQFPGRSPTETSRRVRLRTGDGYAAEHPSRAPNLVKIDVEGYELDVLQGMERLLRETPLRGVFVEVHFSILAARGMRDGPAEIVRFLRRFGFDVHWVDPSHLAAVRQEPSKAPSRRRE